MRREAPGTSACRTDIQSGSGTLLSVPKTRFEACRLIIGDPAAAECSTTLPAACCPAGSPPDSF